MSTAALVLSMSTSEGRVEVPVDGITLTWSSLLSSGLWYAGSAANGVENRVGEIGGVPFQHVFSLLSVLHFYLRCCIYTFSAALLPPPVF